MAFCSVGWGGACTSGESDPGGATVRDSAGITIVEREHPLWGAVHAWVVEEGDFGIGSLGGEVGQDLYRVVGAAELPDGTIVVANAGTGELRRYGPSGRFLEAVGGLGDGPSEFRAMSWLGRGAGDSLLVWDRGRDRISVFANGLEHVRDYAPATLPEVSQSLEVRGFLSDGSVLLSRGASFIPRGTEPGVQRQPLSPYLVSPTGELLQVFGPFPGEAVYLQPGRREGTIIRTPIPFGGSTLVAAGGNLVFVADNGGFDIRVYDLGARLVRILRRPFDPVVLSSEDIEADIERRLEPLPPMPEVRAGIRVSLEAVPKPELMPPLKSMMTDLDGYLWVENERPTAAAMATWSVFGVEQGWLADVELPAAARPLEIGTAYLLAVVPDPTGVEVLRMYALDRGATTGSR